MSGKTAGPVVVVVVVMLWAVLSLVVGVALAQNDCRFQTKCNGCIQTPGCMWCSKFKDNAADHISHCLPTTSSEASLCDSRSLENPNNTQEIVINEPLSSSDQKTRRGETIIQIAPQRMKLKLRKGTAEKVQLTYKQAVGYPIDLYYLMDLSYSMLDDKRQLAFLGSRLTATLQNLTEFYTIGFGSFVDKVLMPFVNTYPTKIDSPCVGCARPYAFRNDLPLGPDGDEFARKVTAAKISGNLDAPEGGFDALMQVIVCKDKIGWRDQARRLIVFSTDAKFHQAGDGKLAGVVVPNDEQCHLNSVGEYDAFSRFDYPSIGQINKMSKEKDIYIIFAVSNYIDIYKGLSELVENSSHGKLSADSSNVVDLVKDQYNKITSVISLTDNATGSISIGYSSSCKTLDPPIMTNKCFNMREGDQVTFTLDVELKECPVGKDREIVEVKTLQDSLVLEIEFECGCNCEQQDDHSATAEICNNQGALVCGVCSCFEGFRGDSCLCAADGTGDDGKDEELCKANPDDTELCSGNGLCICGSCDCIDDFSGKFCHCNRRRCLSDKGEMCSGRGSCSCDKCSCTSGYTGRVCECQTEDACRRPGSVEICSGHGDCDCGRCICTSDQETSYSGQYCEDCLTCGIGKCSEFFDGVLCRFHDPTSSACNLTTIAVDSVEGEHELGARLCSLVDEEDGCKIIFTYRYVDASRSYVIHVLREKQCPTPVPIMGIVFGILAGIVAIGLLTLLLWKLLTSIHDRKEYARFESERQNARWNAEGNPLYKDPTNTFVNPAFSQQQASTN